MYTIASFSHRTQQVFHTYWRN